MSFHHWLQNLRSALAPGRGQRHHRRRGSLRAATHRPKLEVLEDRTLPSFAAPVNYATDFVPLAVVAADFNNDGIQDLAVANRNGNSVSILLGNGDGTFQAAHNIGAGGIGPVSLAAADFNGDGNLDLAVANLGGGVSVLLGNGSGGFGAPSSVGVPGNPASVAVGDFNRDGKLDLAVTSNVPYHGYYTYPAYANVLLGNGDGTFGALNSTNLGGGGHTGAAVADFNGDGWPDFATVNSEGSVVSVLLGNGAGGLGAPTNYSVGSEPSSVVAGDVNHDGHIDLVAANDYFGGVSVLLNDGLGAFALAHSYSSSSPNISIATLADCNHDGNLDVVTTGDDGVSVYLGRGDGSFSLPVLARAGSYPAAAAAADFNGDGWADLATANSGGSDASVLINDQAWPAANAHASNFTVSGFPSPTTAGVSGSFTVTAKTSSGWTDTGYTGTIHFSSSDRQAGLPADYTFTAADQGVHTFSATLKTAGTQSITAKDTVTGSITGTDGGITVNPAAASQFIISAPSSVSAGVPFSLTVTVQDAYGNVVTGYTGTIHFKSTDNTASLPANYTFTAADKGVHTFTGLVLRKKGTQKITITETLNSSLSGSVIENVL